MLWAILSQAPGDIYWRGLKKDVLGRGRATAAGSFSGPSSLMVLWNRTLTAITGTYSGPSVFDVTGDGIPEVIVGDNGGVLWCFNGPDGTVRWTFTSGGAIYSTPAIDNIIGSPSTVEVAFTSYNGNLYVLRGTDGSLIWSTYVGYAYNGSPRSYDINSDGFKEVVVATGSGTYAFRGVDGSLVWSNASVSSDAAVAVWDVDSDGQVEIIVADGSGNVKALRGTDGSLKWSVASTCGGAGSAPAIEDVNGDGLREIFVNFSNNCTCRINGNGTLAWCVSGFSDLSFDGLESVIVGPDINGNGTKDIFTADYWNNFAALDGGTGSVIWSRSVTYEAHSHAPITITDFDITNPGYEILFADHNGYLNVYSASNGAWLWSYSYGGPVGGCCASGYTVMADVNGDTCVELILRGEADAPNIYVFKSTNVYTCSILGWDDPVSVYETRRKSISITPSRGGIEVKGKGRIYIYNLSGSKVKEENISGKAFIYLPSGVYFVVYGNERERVVVSK